MLAALLFPLIAGVQTQVVLQENFDGPEGNAKWATQTWSGRAQFIRAAKGRTGNGVAVTSAAGADSGWTLRISVEPYAKYRVRAWMKTEGVAATTGQGALLNLHERPEHSKPLTGDNDWTEVGFDFETNGEEQVQLNLLLGYFGLARGTAFFDDVSVELLSTRTLDPQVTLDAAKTGEPISKYVYGQFIEHLGRCIYGGIWAEMLEDRKFYYMPGSKESPWKVTGNLRLRLVHDRYREQPVLEAEGEGAIEQSGPELKPGVGIHIRHALGGNGSVEIALVHAETGRVLERSLMRFDNEISGGGQMANKLAGSGPLTMRVKINGSIRIAALSLMPADNVHGFRKDTLDLLKQLGGTIYRWPGGNFVSAYDWRDGIGDRDRRPTRKNPAWQGIDSNDMGLHEFLDFCDLIGTEPEIVVNTGFGDAHSAMEEVEYVLGPPTSEWGAKRVKNGRRQPWNVRWWAVGNEMFGNWQHGYMDLRFYVQKHNDFARYMRRVDPTIKLIGVGNAGSWTEGMLKNCADAMDLVSEHFYVQERSGIPAHVAQMPRQVKRIADAHREYRRTLPNLKGRDIRISLDEWNYWYGPHVYGELGTIYYQKDALGVAAGLHEIFRNSDLYFMANYAQTVNVIGAIKTTKTKAAFDTTGLVLMKYREVFGSIPLRLGGAPEPLDVMAALSEDRKTLTIGIVNPTGEEQSFKLTFAGLNATRPGVRWELAAEPHAYNTPDKPDVVKWVKSVEPAPGPTLAVKPYSNTLLVMPLG